MKSLNDGHADDQKRDEDMDVDAAPSSTKTRKKEATAQRKKRKAPEPDSDMAEDSDFVPEEKDDDSDEAMDEDEDEDEEYSHRVRKVAPIFQKNSNFSTTFPVRVSPQTQVMGSQLGTVLDTTFDLHCPLRGVHHMWL